MRKVIFVCDICQKEFENDTNIFTLKYEKNSKVNANNLSNEHYYDFSFSISLFGWTLTSLFFLKV